MIKIATFFLLTFGVAFAAPRYGEDGGYAGYASYKPGNINTLLKKLGSKAHREPVQPVADTNEYGNRLQDHAAPAMNHDLDTPKDDYAPVPKTYEALRPKKRPQYQQPSYGRKEPSHPVYGGNQLYESPSSPYSHASKYGNGQNGYRMSDVYAKGYDGGDQIYHNDYPDSPQPYEYGYQVKDEHGNEQFKKEIGDGNGKVQGSYGFRDEHGIYRQVDYVADKGGFRANIRTNEPGTENKNPADVQIDSAESKY